MGNIERFDTKAARLVHEGAIKALADYAKGLGLTVKAVGGRFNDNALTAKIEFAVTVRGGQRVEPAADDFRKYMTLFDFKAEDLGATFQNRGESFKLVGLLPNKRAFPVLGERLSDGKRMCFRAEDVVKKLHPGRPTLSPLVDVPGAPVAFNPREVASESGRAR